MPSEQEKMEQVIRKDGRYPLDAYAFLQEGMARAAKAVHGDEGPLLAPKHVTGQQICESIRDLAVERWGQLAKAVLGRWNVHTTLDFGNMVYLMIEHRLMKKTEEDRLEDFQDVFDFDEAFKPHDEFELKE
jgi:uncharacterized repeat protein (TIGR04138 family)